jgi:hypothetical protein
LLATAWRDAECKDRLVAYCLLLVLDCFVMLQDTPMLGAQILRMIDGWVTFPSEFELAPADKVYLTLHCVSVKPQRRRVGLLDLQTRLATNLGHNRST